jgi:hypothetical protein
VELRLVRRISHCVRWLCHFQWWPVIAWHILITVCDLRRCRWLWWLFMIDWCAELVRDGGLASRDPYTWCDVQLPLISKIWMHRMWWLAPPWCSSSRVSLFWDRAQAETEAMRFKRGRVGDLSHWSCALFGVANPRRICTRFYERKNQITSKVTEATSNTTDPSSPPTQLYAHAISMIWIKSNNQPTIDTLPKLRTINMSAWPRERRNKADGRETGRGNFEATAGRRR